MLLDILIVLVACAGAYCIGWLDGRESEERNWINSYNNLGVMDDD